MGAGEWLGFTNADGSGIYFELLKRIYPEKKLSITVDSYNRALYNFEKQKTDMIVGVYREDVQQATIPDWFLDTEAPIVAFYDPSVTSIENIADISDKTISWVRGYHFERIISGVKDAYLVNNVQKGFELLNKNRIDVLLDFPYNKPNNLKQRYNTFEVAPARYIYIAFQKNKAGLALAQQFDQNMANLRRSGELAKIFGDRYPHSNLDSFANNAERIIVFTDDSNLSAQNKNLDKGSMEGRIINLIQARLQHHQIEFEILLSLENLKQYGKKDKTCFNDMVKTTEREQDFIFSNPTGLFMGLRLYSKTDLDIAEPITLSDFFAKRPEAKLGVTLGQQYGAAIAQQLSLIKPKQIVAMPANKFAKYNMFKEDSFTYMLQYPEEIARNWSGVSSGKLYSYELTGVDQYVLAHMMCSKTPSGSDFIQAYNEALAYIIKSGAFFDIHVRHIDEDSQQDFIEHFNKVFKQ